MTGVYIGAGTALVGAYSATRSPSGGSGGGDAAAAMMQAQLDREAMMEQNRYNNPDLISNTGREERRWIKPVKAKPAVKARPAKYDKHGVLVEEAREARPAVKGSAGRYQVTQTMAPEMEASQDAAIKAAQDWTEKAAAQGEFKGPDQIQWEDPQVYADRYRERAMFGVATEQAAQMEKFNTKLRQQGLQPGTPAYDRAMKNMMDSQGDVSTKASLDAWFNASADQRQNYGAKLAGQSQNRAQQLDDYGRPLSRAMGFQGFGQSIQPNTPGAGRASGAVSTDLIGAYNSSQDRAQAADNARAAQMSEAFKGLSTTLPAAYKQWNTP